MGIELTQEDFMSERPLPANWYVSQVVSAQYKNAVNPDSRSEFVELKLRIAKGEFEGQHVTTRFYVRKRDGAPNPYAVRPVAKLIDSTGMKDSLKLIDDSIARLADKIVYARIKHEEGEEGFEDRNEIKDFRSKDNPPRSLMAEKAASTSSAALDQIPF